jgi:hypothetical protein
MRSYWDWNRNAGKEEAKEKETGEEENINSH